MSGSRTRPAQGARSKPADRRRREKAAQRGVQKPAPSAKPPSGRAARAAERRQAIIEAALDEFVARGFAATRLDDVAKRDRKSTRLNSSHLGISYAVFCLKKKKHTTQPPQCTQQTKCL